jgi:hypothetical protein
LEVATGVAIGIASAAPIAATRWAISGFSEASASTSPSVAL